MKKEMVGALLSMSLMAIFLTGCKDEADTPAEPVNNENMDTEQTKDENSEEIKNSGDENSGVYMLNAKPETDAVWQKLAEMYSKKTGVEVTINSPAIGEYNSVLEAELNSGKQPTIFTINNVETAQNLDEYIYDMKDTSVYKHLTDKILVIENNGKVAGVANSYECYGIIYNKAILNDYCSMDGAVIKSAEDIKNFDVLFEVANDINNRKEELNDEFGYDITGAFASSALDSSSSLRFTKQLASLPLYYEFRDDGCDMLLGEPEIDGKYLEQFKRVWDMYLSTSGMDIKRITSDILDARTEFGTQEAVFYQNGDGEYKELTNPGHGYFVAEEDLGMMPIYFGVDDVNQGLCVGTENYWAINSKAEKKNIDDSLAFLEWAITSDEGRLAISEEMGIAAPFDTFTGQYATTNAFVLDANRYMTEGKKSVAWSYLATPNAESWRSNVVEALIAYSEGIGDWADVRLAFVDGWNN